MTWPGGTRTPGTPPDKPSRARIFSRWLGGYQYTKADEVVADEIERINPAVRELMGHNRLFASHVTGWAVGDGEVAQVIDLSCGFPAAENVHEAAQSVRPGAQVAYVDDDPEVTASFEILFEEHPAEGVTVVPADFRDPGAVFGHPQLRKVIDLDEPVFLLFAMALPILPPDEAAKLVAEYAERIAPGSCIGITCPRFDQAPTWDRIERAFTAQPLFNFTRGEFSALFEGLDLVPPGAAPVVYLRPGFRHVPERPPGPAYILGGVGRKS